VGDLSNLDPIINNGMITNEDILNSSLDKVLAYLDKKK
jgi:hypothetical protein